MIVYTSVLGKAEKLYDPLKPGDHKFVCFTDLPIKSKVWEIRRPETDLEGRLAARWHKLHPHILFPDALESIWIDANMQLLVDPDLVCVKARGHEMVGLVHPKNDTILEEAAQINASLKIPMEILNGMISRYRDRGFKAEEHRTVTSTGFLFRRHTPAMRIFHEIWWQEVLCCVRDQMSVDFAAKMAGITIKHFAWHFRNCEFFQYYTHEGLKAKIRPRNLTMKYGRTFLR